MSIYDLNPALGNGERMLLDTPDCDHEEFINQVTAAERARVREIFSAFREMIAARSLKIGAESAALKRHHLGWGWSAKSLLNLFRVYRDGGHKPGDWRKLGPAYKAGDWRILLRDFQGSNEQALSPEFVRWLNEQWAQFRGRTDCVAATWRHVVYELWLKGAPVPGYGTIDEWCRRTGRARPHPQLVRLTELPEGWSERTFRRKLPKRSATRQVIAHGYLAAHNAQPDQVLTDRSPLLPLQYVFLDDSRPDLRCTWFGAGTRGEIVYPLLVMGLDAATGVDLSAVTKPRALKSDSDDQRHGVTQDMALGVVVGTLRRLGMPPWPITFVHENAAACVPSAAKHALHGAYGDRIRFEATGIFKAKMLAHGFTDQGGAPYDKAPIESFWRILMTQLARLPGSTGPRYDTAPGELQQIERYTLGLMQKAGGVEALFKRFQSPLLDFAEADAAIMDGLRLLRFRTVHNLQGFDRVREWRPSPADGYRPWSEFLSLPEAQQNSIAMNGDRDAIINRMEAPAERFCRLLQGVAMTPVDDDLLTWIEGPRQPVRVRNGKITVSTKEHGDDAIIFRETDHPLLGEEAEGREFEAAIARDGQRIVLTEEGRLLGSVARQGLVVRGTDEWRQAAGRVAAARTADRAHLRGYYLADTDAALAEMRARNVVVAASPELTSGPTREVPTKAPRISSTQRRSHANRAAQMAAAAQAQLSAE